MQASNTIVNISAYKFVTFDDTVEKRPLFLEKCVALGLKGTILLSPEGINMFLAGSRQAIDGFMDWLHTDPRFADVVAKESFSDDQPFNKMLVKLKREIITMKHPLIKPELGRAPAVTAETLRRWLDQGQDDEGKPVVMMDTRNDFEVDVGTFDDTLDYRITKFSEFPDVVASHKDELQGKTVVTFCTGGIRCEKAAIYMKNVGYDSVYQLEGGILKYFEEVGGAHYTGDCFVFDHRTALNPQLEPSSETATCPNCKNVVTPREQLSPAYLAGQSCPHCPQP
ncbi:sulfurtransferase [uncultured Oxalicibacterium sp.]|uniref:sulfurtransferase n=1 Tax=uncultured Oxalicibacterium sp. TaxID=1168540 RepID=UPI0025D9A39E|nr:sulfurtransferase [uncultured Oxalicibacterium sp.]